MSYFAYGDKLPDWAAQVPENWGRNWLKWSVNLSTERPTEEEKESLPYISNEDIVSWTGSLLIESPEPAEADSRRFQKNDVLFNKLRPYLAKVYHATFDGLSSGELLCLRPSPAVHPRFLFYVLVSKGFIDTVNAETFGAKMPRADWEIVGHQSLPLPPLATQRRIARFLDEKTARIGRLIEKKREVLDRLAEKRQALITRAVTKRLDPRAGTKVFGIDDRKTEHQSVKWARRFSEIPENVREAYRGLPPDWKLEKLKFFASVRNSNVDKVFSEDEEPVRLCNYTDVYYNDRITSDLLFMEGSATPAEIELFHIKRDQVIITKDSEGWDDIGIPALVDQDMPDVLCGYHLAVFEPDSELDGGFLAWLCRAEPLNDQFKLAAKGVTRFGLGQYAMKNAFIALPPLATQRRIARFLDERTVRIDKLVEKIMDSMERLEEYRSAQITAAVTGQLAGLR